MARLHHGREFGRRGVGFRRHVERAGVVTGARPCRAAGRARRPRRRAARPRACKRGLRADARLGPHRRDHGDRVLHRIEHHDERRPDQHRVGNADRIGIGRRAVPPSAAPCRSRDSRTRRPPSAAGPRAARCGFRRSARAAPRAAARGQGAKAVGIAARRAVDLGARRRSCARSGRDRARSSNSGRAPRRLRPTRTGSSSAAPPAIFRNAETGVSRSATSVVQTHLRFAAVVARGEGVGRRLDLHGGCSVLRAAAGDLVQRALIDADADLALQPRDVLRDQVFGVARLQRFVETLGVGRPPRRAAAP